MKPALLALLLLWLLTLPVKWLAAHNMGWDIDFVPVVAYGLRFLEGGAFPVHGTLSSVAAYNMPLLVWLHLPALALTRSPYMAMLLTLLVWNGVGTLYAFIAGRQLAGDRAGLAAAALFTLSETGVSGSYTAWAQLLLPTFYLVVWVHLWRWQATGRGVHLALCGSVATAALMTHFSAIVLYPALLVMALLTRARWQGRWLAAGTAISLALLLPYGLFQIERDFVDIRAFLTRQPTIPAAVLAQYRSAAAETPAPPPVMATTPRPNTETPPPAVPATDPAGVPPRWQRALLWALDAPRQMLAGLLLFAASGYSTPALW
ncbi:MAG: hypothetical protein MUE40_19730, partial [Anaerolineae bacterium]|nr:hypothetical protein [Anaerolineae bacterium]